MNAQYYIIRRNASGIKQYLRSVVNAEGTLANKHKWVYSKEIATQYVDESTIAYLCKQYCGIKELIPST